jgi:hypothetical protein
MTKAEVARLLAVAAAFDQRTSGEEDDIAWLAAIGDLNFNDARNAVIAYYRECRERIMPVDVRERVAEIRKQRIAAAPPVEIPEHLADRPIEARDWKQRTLQAIADGADPQRAIGSGQ